MTDYVSLQYKMASRRLVELGVNPFFGLLSGLAGFILVSEYLFYSTQYAEYVVILAAFSLLVSVPDKNKTEFLKMVYGDKKARLIRISENILLALPFSILLLYHSSYIGAMMILLMCPLLSLNSFHIELNFTLPTPFYKRPFEFVAGFRNTFYMLPLAYLLAFISLSVDNFNLGIFALMLVFLICLTYYLKPENAYFIWIYSGKPQKFLLEKIKTATFFSGLLALPVVLGLLVYFPGSTDILLLFLLLGFAFLWTIQLGKYSAYPNEMNLPEGILIAICTYFPPLLLALMPFFYVKAVKKLSSLLK